MGATREICLASLVLTLIGPGLRAQDKPLPAPQNPLEALRQAEFGGRLRYRFDRLDQDDRPEVGQASTLRASLHMTTGTWAGLQGFLELYSTRASVRTPSSASPTARAAPPIR